MASHQTSSLAACCAILIGCALFFASIQVGGINLDTCLFADILSNAAVVIAEIALEHAEPDTERIRASIFLFDVSGAGWWATKACGHVKTSG